MSSSGRVSTMVMGEESAIEHFRSGFTVCVTERNIELFYREMGERETDTIGAIGLTVNRKIPIDIGLRNLIEKSEGLTIFRTYLINLEKNYADSHF